MTIDLRLARPDDAPGILAIYAPYCESTSVSFEAVAPSEKQIRERIDRITGHYPWLVGEIEGEVAGYVYASQHRERAAYRWTVDVAVYVATQHQGQSLGRALYTSLFAILRARIFQGVCRHRAAEFGQRRPARSDGLSIGGLVPGAASSRANGSTSAGGSSICNGKSLTRLSHGRLPQFAIAKRWKRLYPPASAFCKHVAADSQGLIEGSGARV